MLKNNNTRLVFRYEYQSCYVFNQLGFLKVGTERSKRECILHNFGRAHRAGYVLGMRIETSHIKDWCIYLSV